MLLVISFTIFYFFVFGMTYACLMQLGHQVTEENAFAAGLLWPAVALLIVCAVPFFLSAKFGNKLVAYIIQRLKKKTEDDEPTYEDLVEEYEYSLPYDRDDSWEEDEELQEKS